ncbi:alginate O-acetyltransferase AlgX-related protein [Spirochaeta africana]|uniref:AlgX/AlgJ SGNH hydrolase-like domain-containing protein n=1 Tax=Spirochaeta africana (strain ATCC 700263 / DSM 8902 / Z-7692) TaxID=889378 RepID=H9UGT7_SPIAZ|nr:hypothetical protein [Spirochaeta africana]AFG36730.1 hypothetical protein Spiaf_0630 [Spirochaeta africana DSM 8902]
MESSKRYTWFGAVLLAVMIGGAIVSLPAVFRAAAAVRPAAVGPADGAPSAPILRLLPGAGLPVSENLTGQITAAFQQEFEQEHPLREQLIGVWGSLRFALFREGAAGVVVGSRGWLFSAEEFVVLADQQQEAARIRRTAEYAAEVQAALQRYGTELVVVPLPAKARVHREWLGRHRFPRVAEPRYQLLLDELQQRSLARVDARAVLQRQAVHQEPPFLRTDTHWSPDGAAAVAAVTAGVVREVAGAGLQEREYRVEFGETVSYRGDLQNFIPLGPFRGRLQPRPDRLPELEVQAGPAPALGLFDAAAVSVVLVGTSYSAGEQWGFQAFLQQELQAEVLNLAMEGRGPFHPMQEYLASDTLREAPPAVVIWEIPERYIALEEPPTR